MPKGLNYSYTSLTPKVSNPTWMRDFQAIRMSNVVNKILSKVIANRLKWVLPKVISKNWSDFVPGKLITNKVIVAFEIFLSMKNRKKGEVRVYGFEVEYG